MRDELVRAIFRGMGGDARGRGSTIAAHMPTLSLLASRCEERIVELGVGRGWSTISLLAGGAPSKTVTSYDIDSRCKSNVMAALGPGAAAEAARWDFRKAKSLEGAADFSDESIGLWFLDTTHTYQDTSEELRVWLPKIRPTGVMCGHDYLLHEHPQWKDSAGVKQAVDEFAALHADRFALQVLPHDMGLFIFWPK